MFIRRASAPSSFGSPPRMGLRYSSARNDGWRETQRALRGQHISAIIFEQTTGTMFAGAFFGSIHASADGGKTWERRDNGMTIHDVYSLAAHVVDGKVRVYAGTQPAHLFVSEDLGMHWSEIPSLREVPTTVTMVVPGAAAYCPHEIHYLRSPRCAHALRLRRARRVSKKHRPGQELARTQHRGPVQRQKPSGGTLLRCPSLFDRSARSRKNLRHRRRRTYTSPTPAAAAGNAGRPTIGRKMSIPTASCGIRKIPTPCLSPPPSIIRQPGVKPARMPALKEKFIAARTAARTGSALAGGLPASLKHEFGALCLEEANGDCAIFGGTTGGEVYCSEDNGESWTLITDRLAPISKKGHERLLAAS